MTIAVNLLVAILSGLYIRMLCNKAHTRRFVAHRKPHFGGLILKMVNQAQPVILGGENDDLQPNESRGEESVMSEVYALSSIPTRILLPIDFSPSSEAALAMASNLAQHFQAELYLLNVIPFFPTATMPDFIPEESFLQDARSAVERKLANCHKALEERGVKSASAIEVGNDVAGNIIEAIDREHIDMVVISTHGISGWHPLVFGSIAEKVVKLVQCPLLLLHSPKPDSATKSPSSRLMEWW